MARAPVSKTGGWGFESLHSCHPGISSSSFNAVVTFVTDRCHFLFLL
jgi:hypothetical protein